MNNETKEKILNHIKSQSLAVISTIGPDGSPQSAVIGFGETADFELIFGTYNTSRKYSNLQQNPSCSFVIGWSNGITVQYEGEAIELSGDDVVTYKEMYYAKNPTARKYEGNVQERYFKVTPRWIRYTDLKHDPWEIIELDF